MKRIYSFLFAAILLALAACNDDNGPANPDSNSAKITWTEKTTEFMADEVDSFTEDYKMITFKETSSKAKTLKAGDIVFLYGKALKKVKSVSQNGGRTVVTTEYCRLNEAIRDGEISWNQPLRFTKEMAGDVQMIPALPGSKILDGNEVEFTFPVGNGMEGKIKVGLNGDRLDADCEVTKKSGAFNVKYAFEGYAQNMKTQGKIKYEGGELKEFGYTNKNIEGEVTVSLTATGSTKDLLNGIELPFALVKVPVVIGGVPCTFNLKVLFVINTEMASLDASAHIKTKFKFNSETGVKYDGTDVGVVGAAGPYNMDFLKDSCWVGSSTAAGINFGITFPRFELALFGEVVVPYVQTAFLIGGAFTAGTKPCLKIDASYIGAIGYDFDFLGLLKFSGKKNLWQYDKNIKKIGDCD